MVAMASLSGSCACGRVKFTAKNPRETVYCYCTTCRKTSGAPYLPFIELDSADIDFQGTEPEVYKKSEVADRGYCSGCGAIIYMTYRSKPEEFGLVAGLVDEGVEHVKKVGRLIYVEEKPEWVTLPAGVPAFREFSKEL